ncbi:hypothetical protein [Rothia nasimurium]|uniref:hypothetical protein n=1 Tax=Rothia nasimurium TaxID=85336 RepID=UPI001F3D2DCB|nr:hypothetical protein [Rothia nasimurium]
MPLKHQAPSPVPISFSQRLTRWATLGACFLLVVIAGGRYGLDALGFLLIPEVGLFCLGLFYLAALTLLVCGTAYILKSLGRIPQPDGARSSTLVLLTTWFAQGLLLLLVSAFALMMTFLFFIVLVFSTDWIRYEDQGKTYYQFPVGLDRDYCREAQQVNLIFARDLGGTSDCWPKSHDPGGASNPPGNLGGVQVPEVDATSAPEPTGHPYSPAPLTPVEAENVTDIDESGTFGLVLANSNDIYAATYTDQGHWLMGGKISTVGAKSLELCGHQRLSETVLVYCQARAEGATLLTSPDNGLTWTTHELDPAASYLLEAHYTNGIYTLEVGYPAWVPSSSTTIITSSDGLTWQTH